MLMPLGRKIFKLKEEEEYINSKLSTLISAI